ncbi:MAG: exodeoxyribonuclease VII small subunit [Lachnospiraceae bacterium]|nr:exodeoxyribonuclease VII small subunit [Lachnospiraceae bacterium]
MAIDKRVSYTDEKVSTGSHKIETSAAEELSIEAAFEKLDGLIGRLEDRDIPLEEAFALYQQGLQLIQTCGEKLDTVEKKIKVLTPDGEMEDFE